MAKFSEALWPCNSFSAPAKVRTSSASLILAEATLSFLGLGVPPGTPSWGALLDQGVSYLFIAPHLAIFPGICIAITVLSFNFLGDGLRDVFDVKNR